MQYLAHDKSNNDHKLDHAGNALSMSQKLSTVQYKIECTKRLLKKMTEDSISEKCDNGKKGVDALVNMICCFLSGAYQSAVAGATVTMPRIR